MLSSSASDMIHVLALYYRGFGKPTGNPTEVGSIIDAVSAMQWAVKMARSLSQIVLDAQDPGTGLACVAANYFHLYRLEGWIRSGCSLCCLYCCCYYLSTRLSDVFHYFHLSASPLR